MLQLWVNLPARNKMTEPGYQAIVDRDIPIVPLPDGAGSVRVIAGEYGGHTGPARTFSPMHVWDLQLDHGGVARLNLPDGWHTALVVLRGSVLVNTEAIVNAAQMVVLDGAGSVMTIEADSDTMALLLSGEPIDEPIVGYGPFVMNSEAEIAQAFTDFNSGRFGRMAP